MADIDAAKPLRDFKPKHKFFVGIDSDGCVFDTMGIKQRECFCPWMIGCFGLQPVAQAARECKEFADLFSRTRGGNRHKTLKRILAELLPTHPMVKVRNFKVLQWSERVNWMIEKIVKDMPPFPYVRETLEKISLLADIIVVSSTPYEALGREWEEHDIAKYAGVMAGQEMGTKKEHLAFAAGDKYEPNNVLMVGDAPGDMKAASANNALFYPINPGSEIKSWQRLHDEAFERFVNGRYAGSYEKKLIAEFDECLPEDAPWKK